MKIHGGIPVKASTMIQQSNTSNVVVVMQVYACHVA